MLGRERREARAVAGGLLAAVTPARRARTWRDGHKRRDCQAEGVCRHWRERRGRPLENGRPLAETEGRTAEGKRVTGGKRQRRLA